MANIAGASEKDGDGMHRRGTVGNRSELRLFKEAMKKELEIFYSAFANKNNLFPPADKVKPRSIEELSPEEKAYYAKVGLMAEGMERHTLRKAIAASETE